MSTFVSTTLTKRTGSTTTVFEPAGVSQGFSYLRATGASALTGPSIRCSQQVTDKYRRATVRIVIPQVDSDDQVVSRPAIDISMYVPAGASNDDVNDLVGYLNALSADTLTNFDSFFVDGVGMY